ncbi:MAG: GNAT family N-acetyltransferase [Cyclobacteriaceae bacterium]
MSSTIRKVKPTDINGLKSVIASSKLFPSSLLEDMIANYFNNPSSEEIWLTKDDKGAPIAVAYCAPEKMTEGTYNLYLIAVHKNQQGKGIGAKIMTHIEELLRRDGQRVLIVETSSLPEFELTRKFYDKCGYEREAVIRDFYQEGEDKIVFWKKLN